MRLHQSDSLSLVDVEHPVAEGSVALDVGATARDLAAPVALGAIARFAAAFLAPLAPQWDGAIYVRGAEQLATGQGYTTAILAESVASPQPTAFYPVGFPAVLAAVRLVGGNRRADLVVQAIFGILTIGLTYAIARAVGGRLTGRRAAWLLALSPSAILLTTTWLAEPAVAFGLALCACSLLAARRRSLPISLALFGFGMGLVAYLRVTSLVIAPIVAFGVGFARRHDASRLQRARLGGLAAAIVTVSALVPLAPWAMRNAEVLGGPALVSTNGGLNLFMGTFGEGGFQHIDDAIDCREDVPELELDACRSRRAIGRIAVRPLPWLGRGVGKLWHTFGHDSATGQHLASAARDMRWRAAEDLGDVAVAVTRVHWLVFIALAFAGSRELLARRFGRAQAVVLGPIVGLAVLHFVFIGGDRYHASVVPFLAVLAALGFGRTASPTS